MLLSMRAMTEGGRALATYVGQQLDVARYATNDQRRDAAQHRVALLTPVAKAFFTDTGLDSTILGQQVFGGHGYIREWGQEQLVRDVRIAQIYEGTNGVQAMDLLGRKVIADGGMQIGLLIDEIIDYSETPGLVYARELRQAGLLLKRDVRWILDRAERDPRVAGASAVEFLHITGYVVYAWLWSRMLMAARSRLKQDSNFYGAKVSTADFFFARLLPRTAGLSSSLRGGPESLFRLHADQF
jgi:hypothetical protein